MELSENRAKIALETLEEDRAQVGRLRRTAKLLQSRCERSVAHYGLRSGSGQGSRSEAWDQLADIKLQLEEHEKLLEQKEAQLEAWISLLPKPRWRMVLRGRYLDGMELPEVAQALSRDTGRAFSTGQVYKLHRNALEVAERMWPLS